MKITTKCVRVAALLAAFALTATACSTSKKPPQTQAKPAAATSTTTVDPDAATRAAVLAALDEYNRFYVQAIASPSPNDPALAVHLTGTALTRMRQDLA